ncbi:hypothetical protein N752_27320 [Desulforamulus aquiferis]|nr:DUF6179 domain-containing protein [Desulforamulus aquiferis]RYD02165.1 hypothetical protein N752_27320 [Desulforamulus aquiferis]
MEKIQLQCLNFLAYKCERYNNGESSSIKVDVAESIMKSNLYTIGTYLKSLPDTECAVNELQKGSITDIYQKGRKLVDNKVKAAKHFYKLNQSNKLITKNYTYNATLSDKGIGIFFKAYDPEYEAHEFPASIDYQLCNPVSDLVGVEFILQYLKNLYLENEFCSKFSAKDIHYLLCGYDESYQELLINIFEQVLTTALGCVLTHRNPEKLAISPKEIHDLYKDIAGYATHTLDLLIYQASEKLIEELNITSSSLRKYIDKSLPRITTNLVHAIKMNNLEKVFVSQINPDLEPKIMFSSGVKMDDSDYRKLIDELLLCRYSSDKLVLIKERVKSFDDLEDVLFDGQLNKEELPLVFEFLGDVEIAALINRHPFISDIQAVDLSEEEKALRLHLNEYIGQISLERQERIYKIMAAFPRESF